MNSRLLIARRRRCWKKTVSCSRDSSFPVRPDSVTCKNYSSMRIIRLLPGSCKRHTCQKSQLTEILPAHVYLPDKEPHGDAIVINSSALINPIPPGSWKTYDDYAKEHVDIVFYFYEKSSLKSKPRGKRGQGIRRVTGASATYTTWKSGLRDESNTTELFHFLSQIHCVKQWQYVCGSCDKRRGCYQQQDDDCHWTL